MLSTVPLATIGAVGVILPFSDEPAQAQRAQVICQDCTIKASVKKLERAGSRVGCGGERDPEG